MYMKVKSQKGMTLVGVLVAVAVMGILAATLASIYEGMTRVMQRTSMQNEVDNMQRFIQGVLSQKVLCDNALRQTFKGARINWNYKTQPDQDIPVIQLWDPKAPPSGDAISILASTLPGINPLTGLPYNQVIPGLTISSIKIRTPDRNNDGVPDTYHEEAIVKNGQTLTAVPAEILISFQAPSTWSGGVFRPRPIPIMAVFDSGFNIRECDVVAAARENKKCDNLAQAYADNGYTAAQGCPLGNGTFGTCSTGPVNGIAQIVFFDGYDNNNTPKCNCQRICGNGPPAGPGVSPMAPGGGAAAPAGGAAPGGAAPGGAAPGGGPGAGPAAPGPGGGFGGTGTGAGGGCGN